MEELRKSFLILFILSLTSFPFVYASSVSINTSPPSTLEDNGPGDLFVLNFGADLSGFESSMFILSLNLSQSTLQLSDYHIILDGVEQTDINLQQDDDLVFISSNSLTPHNGTIVVRVILGSTTLGFNEINWRFIVTGFEAPPNPPSFKDALGITKVWIINPGLNIEADSNYNPSNGELRISATIICSVCEVSTVNVVEYDIINALTQDSIGFSGDLIYSSETGEYSTIVELLDFAPENHQILINVVDNYGHEGEISIPIIEDDPSLFYINTQGLSHTQNIQLQINGTTYSHPISDSNPFSMEKPPGNFDVSVPKIIQNGLNTRLVCDEYTVPLEQDTNEHVFIYRTEHKLEIQTEHGTISVIPQSNDGYYTQGTQAILEAIAENGLLFDEWTGTGLESYTGPNNPVTITINSPIVMLVAWTETSEDNSTDNGDGEASFHFSDFYVLPEEISVGQSLDIRYKVRNIGASEGSITILVLLDRAQIFSDTIVLQPDQETTILNELSLEEIGEHIISIRSMSRTINVIPKSGLNMLYYYVIPVALAIIVLLIKQFKP